MNNIKENTERLISAFSYIMSVYPDENNISPNFKNLDDMILILNNIFEEENIKCTDVLFTRNTDKFFFGLKVNPAMNKNDVIKIVSTSEPINLRNYQIEFDSKLFEIGLSEEEIAIYTLYEISSMMISNEAIDKLRTYIDVYLTTSDDVISIRDSVHYYQMIIYAIKDTLVKITSMLYKDNPEDVLNSNNFINSLEANEIAISAHQKIIAAENGPGDSMRSPNVVLLRWMFIMYRSMDVNSNVVRETLKDAKDITGSKLDKEEIDKTLRAIDSIDTSIAVGEDCDLVSFLESNNISIVNESLFGGLKKRGLRSLEDDLYTISMQIKNLETENDAIYTMRSINTRLNILEDYLYTNSELPESERKHWQGVADKYRMVREELVRKKIWNKKNYGLFFDYNQLDNLDKPE